MKFKHKIPSNLSPDSRTPRAAHLSFPPSKSSEAVASLPIGTRVHSSAPSLPIHPTDRTLPLPETSFVRHAQGSTEPIELPCSSVRSFDPSPFLFVRSARERERAERLSPPALSLRSAKPAPADLSSDRSRPNQPHTSSLFVRPTHEHRGPIGPLFVRFLPPLSLSAPIAPPLCSVGGRTSRASTAEHTPPARFDSQLPSTVHPRTVREGREKKKKKEKKEEKKRNIPLVGKPPLPSRTPANSSSDSGCSPSSQAAPPLQLVQQLPTFHFLKKVKEGIQE